MVSAMRNLKGGDATCAIMMIQNTGFLSKSGERVRRHLQLASHQEEMDNELSPTSVIN